MDRCNRFSPQMGILGIQYHLWLIPGALLLVFTDDYGWVISTGPRKHVFCALWILESCIIDHWAECDPSAYRSLRFKLVRLPVPVYDFFALKFRDRVFCDFGEGPQRCGWMGKEKTLLRILSSTLFHSTNLKRVPHFRFFFPSDLCSIFYFLTESAALKVFLNISGLFVLESLDQTNVPISCILALEVLSLTAGKYGHLMILVQFSSNSMGDSLRGGS